MTNGLPKGWDLIKLIPRKVPSTKEALKKMW